MNENNMITLGISILIIGILLGSYSFSTYREAKILNKEIDFELVDGNNDMSATEKYYKYLGFADFLNQKLNKNKNIPIKNASCMYLDYAEHNALQLYNLTEYGTLNEQNMKDVAAGNVRTLSNILDSYNTCSKTANYKTELAHILKEIENQSKMDEFNQIRMEEFKHSPNNIEPAQDQQTMTNQNIQPANSEGINNNQMQTQTQPQQQVQQQTQTVPMESGGY